jgi:hypothetical protein
MKALAREEEKRTQTMRGERGRLTTGKKGVRS